MPAADAMRDDDSFASTAPAVSGAEYTSDGRIKFHCGGCGGSLKVPENAIGKRVKCPRCSAALTVPNPSAGGDGDELFSGLVGGQALDVPRPAPASPGTIITSPQPPGGLNGKSAAKSGGAALAGVGRALSQSNSLVIGCVFSAIGAAVGGLIWFLIAYNTGYEVGYVAWGVGGLAGLGMHLGCRDAYQMGGAIAAGMSVLGIVIAKFLVFTMVLEPLLAGAKDLFSADREGLIALMATTEVAELENAGQMSDEEGDRAFEKAEEKAKPIVEKMTDEQVKAKHAQLSEQLVDNARSSMKGAFFKVAFGPLDLLFFGLAIVTAFKVGSTGTTKST